MELKPHFRGYLIDPIKTMWRRRTLKKQDQDTLGQIGSEGFERSVVRPYQQQDRFDLCRFF